MNIFSVVLCLSLFAPVLHGATETVPVLAEDIASETEHKSGGHSIAPIVGYDPTFGFVVGGAYFFEADGLSFQTDANWNFANVYQWHLNIAHKFARSWQYGVHVGLRQGFDPYYLEGGETKVSDFSRLWGAILNSRAQVMHFPSKLFGLGVFSDFRVRTEVPKAGEVFNRRAPDEATVSLGVIAQVDNLDNPRNPGDGFKFVTTATIVPNSFSTIPGAKTFGQVESTFIVYKEILKDVLPNWIAAFNVQGGLSIGEPSYMYRFKLGGANELRGYLANRFRGDKYYLQQTELRFPIYGPVGGATFLGFGDATDTEFTNPKMAYGFGLRVGLPPDFVSQIRLDVGVGRDEWGFFANFGQTF